MGKSNPSLKPAAEDVQIKSEPKPHSGVRKIITLFVTVLSIAYLVAIPLGKIGNEHKFGVVETVLLAIVLLFNSGLIQRLERFAISEKGLEIQLEQIQAKQNQQQLQIKTLIFLLGRFVTDAELGHLRGLILDKPFPYKKSSSFEAELRHLRDGGLIKGKKGVTVGGLSTEGNLKDFFEITPEGKAYLEYRQEFDKLS